MERLIIHKEKGGDIIQKENGTFVYRFTTQRKSGSVLVWDKPVRNKKLLLHLFKMAKNEGYKDEKNSK